MGDTSTPELCNIQMNPNASVPLYIPIGLQCSVPTALQDAGVRSCSFPFDWLWTPARTILDLITMLLTVGTDAAANLMTTGFGFYRYNGDESYTRVRGVTESQMNEQTGLGITHFTISPSYCDTLRRRLNRLRSCLLDHNTRVVLIYADAACPERNYRLDGKVYGVDAMADLDALHAILVTVRPVASFEIRYFRWSTRPTPPTASAVSIIPFDPVDSWAKVADIIKQHVAATNPL